MKVTGRLTNLAVRALAESLDIRTMVALTQQLLHNYDLQKRTGFPDNIPVPRKDAAQQIIADIKKANLYTQMINCLVEFQYEGHMGRKYTINHLPVIVKEMREQGIIYDRENKIFVEDPSVRRTRNWGTLLEGEEYLFSFLRFDIVGNTALVRKYPEKIIKKTYNDFGKIVKSSIEKRSGRIWSWEGDGGLIAFFFSNKNLYATLSAMEIVHDLFFYNQMQCKLEKPLGVRLAVHSGPMEYTNSEEDLKRNDVIRKIVEIEAKHTKPNTLTVSNLAASMFDTTLIDQFEQIKVDPMTTYYNYGLNWEK